MANEILRFTNKELLIREGEARRNAEAGIHLAAYNNQKAKIEAANVHYKATQSKLANMYEELRKYREADLNYSEPEETEG